MWTLESVSLMSVLRGLNDCKLYLYMGNEFPHRVSDPLYVIIHVIIHITI